MPLTRLGVFILCAFCMVQPMTKDVHTAPLRAHFAPGALLGLLLLSRL